MLNTSVFLRRVGNGLCEKQLNFQNRIFHSHVTNFSKDERDSGLSIKLVLKGEELYSIDGHTHRLTDGRYLIVNHHREFLCQVHSRQPVEGMCFYLNPEDVQDIYQGLQSSHLELLDNPGIARERIEFMEKPYALRETELGQFLRFWLPLLRNPESNAEIDFPEFFHQLGEKMVRSQIHLEARLSRISNSRQSTREEIYRRVSRVRNFIDDCYLDELTLEDMAMMAHLSKFHFLRCFKEVYGISPYQYVIRCRLARGKSLLESSRNSLSEIAHQTGFTDRRAFNKAFRKAFGQSPAQFRAG